MSTDLIGSILSGTPIEIQGDPKGQPEVEPAEQVPVVEKPHWFTSHLVPAIAARWDGKTWEVDIIDDNKKPMNMMQKNKLELCIRQALNRHMRRISFRNRINAQQKDQQGADLRVKAGDEVVVSKV